MIKNSILFLASILLYTACSAQFKFEKTTDKVPSHEKWTKLLQKHVANNGDVNYKGFIQDSLELNSYLSELSKAAPNPETWKDEDQLAYWINAYNAFTIQVIIRNYPLKSIKDIAGKIPFINTTWDIKFIRIGGEKLDLNNIEHGIIRKQFDEARIHFAVNCASVSCPRLRNEAYEGSKLEAQLEDQTKYFLNNTVKNQIGDGSDIKISKLFDWFAGDFKEKYDGPIDFISKYKPEVTKDSDVDYLEYNWKLNE